jgi:hypothetical protein
MPDEKSELERIPQETIEIAARESSGVGPPYPPAYGYGYGYGAPGYDNYYRYYSGYGQEGSKNPKIEAGTT